MHNMSYVIALLHKKLMTKAFLRLEQSEYWNYCQEALD